jgi:hypothetical protein
MTAPHKEPTMRPSKLIVFASAVFVAAAFHTAGARPLLAHCDGLDGPVVKAARQALEKGNVDLVLVWVQKSGEPEIVAAFHKTLAVRKLSREAQELADMYFFETLVRVHRAGEGEPYTGLKPAGRDLGPAIAAADQAVDTAKPEPVMKLLDAGVRREVGERFRKVLAHKNYRPDDVEAGRAYVESYVSFVTYIERLYETITGHADSHAAELQQQAAGKH